ncbi:GtrA family protein [Nocardia higoensis]|uniref:GtrA family protein n=1 Tax=Nocardia higoensis TaxID=228599 RepID=UPI000305900E|nr:GtrA family protein [Nocardia higoensis]
MSYPDPAVPPAELSAAASVPVPGEDRVSSRAIDTAALRKGSAFLVVGGIGFLADAGVYNLLVFWGGEGVMYHSPLPAKIIAIAVATVVTYFGNKWWTYGDKKSDNPVRQYLLYALFNVAAIALQLGCLAFSRYVLGLSSPLADNIAGTFVGQAVAVVFRYWAYDKFVFTDSGDRPAEHTGR